MKRKGSKSKEPKAPRPTVLVADDSPVIRKIVQLCLTRQDIEVLGVSSGAAAIERLKKSVPALVLADTVMPAPDGYQLCERIKAEEFGEAVPVVLLVDLVEPLDAARASASGADGHMAKPFEAQTLQLMVSDQLGLPPPVQEMSAASSLVSPALQESSRRFLGATNRDSTTSPSGDAGGGGGAMNDLDLDAVARRVVSMLSDDVVREVAWEVVPELSEVLIKERLQQDR